MNTNDFQGLTITAIGGTTFQISDNGDYLGLFDFGSIDDGGRYQESDDEIMAEARENFGFPADYPARVL